MKQIPDPTPPEPVALVKMLERFSLVSLTPDISVGQTTLKVPNISRPGLQLAGFYEHFNHSYVQVLGRTEMHYLESLSESDRDTALSKLFESKIPCVIITHGIEPPDGFLIHATISNVPVYSTNLVTSEIVSEILRWLKIELAPSVTLHGVLLDLFGEGVIIMGDSGVGKSETALQLIKRGHRLIADDAVEIRRISTGTLMGTCPSIIQYFIEVRGIGIIDVKQMFGVQSIKDSQIIDLILYLEHFNEEKSYDRMGLESHTIEILGQKIAHVTIPIRPGRDLAIICESAAVNHRQKKMGYNAAEELSRRLRSIIQERE